MSAIFVVDRSAKEPSPLVQRLSRAGYHTLCLADCQTALETLRCVRPELMIVDVAAMGVQAGVGVLTALGNDTARPVVTVLIVGAKLSDFRDLSGLLNRGEILPAVYSTPDDVLSRVRRYVEPKWPPGDEVDASSLGSSIAHDGRQGETSGGLLG